MKRSMGGLKGGGNWYKGNLHSHTVNSDGKLTSAESVKLFQDNGYHLLCPDKHNLYTDYHKEFDNPEFIILPGLKASAALLEKEDGIHRKKVHYIHGILRTELMQQKAVKPPSRHMERLEVPVYYGEWGGVAVAQQLADKLTARGCITICSHPV